VKREGTSSASARGLRRYNVMVPMRDGVRLATDLFLPPDDGPHPTVLGRTPYNKNNPLVTKSVSSWNARGYALVMQDVRGRGDSDGEFTPYVHDPADGYDTIEWIAQQPWSGGDVATSGGSYGGRISWLTALEHPPSLRAMIVAVSPSDPFVEFPTCGESPMSISWFRLVDRRLMQNIEGVDWMSVYDHLPLQSMDERAGFVSHHWRQAMAHTSRDQYWEPLRYQHRFGELDLPVLHVSGWYDDEQIGTPLNFSRMAAAARSEQSRRSQRLLMGPWGHAINSTQKLGEVDFGSQSVIDLNAYFADWLDSVLGRGTGVVDPPVRIYVMGANAWRDEGEWPLARTVYTDYFLHSGGAANSRFGDGSLTAEAPGADEPADTYLYDPARAVPFITAPESAQIGGPDDYAAIEQRGDVLCYSTNVLDTDVEVTGPVRLVLFASSSAVDTDFTAKLVDVHPTGFCQRLCDSVIRARYRDGVDTGVPMEPDTVYRFEIDMWNTSQVFKAGHRIRLEVSSSAFPKYDRNLNTGEPIGSATRMLVAENRVWHGSTRPSRLVLPVIPPAARPAETRGEAT
jgi:putative CocE/NonD family hydrolase